MARKNASIEQPDDQIDETEFEDISNETEPDGPAASFGDTAGYAIPKGSALDNQNATNPVRILLVEVERDASTRTPVEIFEYELPVLEMLHGEEAVQVKKQRMGKSPHNAVQAHNALKTKYSGEAGRAAVLAAYPKPSHLSKASGLPWRPGDDSKFRQEASLNINRLEDDWEDADKVDLGLETE